MSIELYKNQIDVAFVTESWWIETSLKLIRGYSIYFKNREKTKGGGVCIFINNNTVKSLELDVEAFRGVYGEHIWCSVNFGAEKLLCGCVQATSIYTVRF